MKGLAAVSIASGLALVTAGSVFALSLVTTVSGPSPYATCSQPAGGGTNFLNAEVEPFVAVNPAHNQNIVGVWQQDRWSNGGARGLVAGFSFTSGKSWGEVDLPFDRCAPGGLPYDRASDPWVSIGPDGTAYTVSISFDNTTKTDNRNAVGAATSGDGGKTWKNVQTITATASFQLFNDKESVTADPKIAGTAYAVWDQLVAPTDNPDVQLHNFSSFTGPAFFSKTTTGGVSWSPPQIIVNTEQNQQTIGNQIVVDRQNGAIYDFFDLIIGTESPQVQPHGQNVAFVKSTDGGTTWSPPHIITSLSSVLVVDPNTGAALRTADFDAVPAIDPATGQLYLAWQDARFTGGSFDQIVFTTSTDGGANWTPVKAISTDTGKSAFNPVLAVNSAGTVGFTYYDMRNLQPGNTTTLPTDVWFKSSADHGAHFSLDTHLDGPFNMLVAPSAGGFFVGDYEGMDVAGTTFHPFFVQTNCADSSCTSNRTDVVTASL